MSQTSERAEPSERQSKFGVGGANLVWVEEIWSGWSKFVVGGVDVCRTVWRVADNLEKTLLCKFLFSWAKFLKLDTYICWFSCEIKYRAMKLMTDT